MLPPKSTPESFTARLADACRRMQSELGSDLRACVLFGSAIRGDLVPKISDLNVLVVLRRSTPEAHELLSKALIKQPIVDPVVVCEKDLLRLFELFPVRFRSMQRNYRVLCGDDPLKDLPGPMEVARFHCEQSLRRIQMRAVRAAVRHCNRPDAYRRFVARTAPGVFVHLAEILRLEGEEVPAEVAQRLPWMEKRLAVDGSTLEALQLVKEGRLKLKGAHIWKFHARLFRLLEQAIGWIEQRWKPIPPAS